METVSNHLRNCQTVFQSGGNFLHSQQQCIRVPHILYSFTNTCYCLTSHSHISTVRWAVSRTRAMLTPPAHFANRKTWFLPTGRLPGMDGKGLGCGSQRFQSQVCHLQAYHSIGWVTSTSWPLRPLVCDAEEITLQGEGECWWRKLYPTVPT